MKTKEKKTYRFIKGSYCCKTILFLKTKGEAKNEEIRKAIGLDNKEKKHPRYVDRGSYYFGCVVIPRLLRKEIIQKTRHGHYTLMPGVVMKEQKNRLVVF